MNIKNIGVLALSLFFVCGNTYAKPDNAKKKSGSLPPGLEKKVSKGKPLPPGWQKKLRHGDVLEPDIYARGSVVVPVGKDGAITIEVEGTLLRLHDKTRQIIEILK